MKETLIRFETRKRNLEKTAQLTRKALQRAPEGRLRVSCAQHNPRFYYVSKNGSKNGSENGMYTSNLPQIRALAQKDYLTKVLKAMERELAFINLVLARAPKERPEEVYGKLIPARKKYVTPVLLDDEEYARRWQAEPYNENPYEPGEKVFATKRGEMVRSKSEAMIADSYYDMGIPYKYDYPVKVQNGKTKYVDFLVLDMRRRQVYYHEHLGLLDDPSYVKKNMIKLREYRAVGIYTGKNLILTQETKDCPLNMSLFRNNMAELFGVDREKE